MKTAAAKTFPCKEFDMAGVGEATDETTDDLSDPGLIPAVPAGKTDRLRKVVKRYRGQVFGYLNRHLREDTETARDLAQTALLKVCSNFGSPTRVLMADIYGFQPEKLVRGGDKHFQ